jgi:predicted nucleic acid-binding protein
MYLLDTNVVSELRRQKPHAAVVAWLESIADEDLFLSAVTLTEIQASIELTRDQSPQRADELVNQLFLKENDRQQAIDLILNLGEKDYQIVVPNLFLYEVLSVATISDYPTKAVHDLLRQHQKINLKLVDIDKPTIEKAMDIAEEGHPKSGYPSIL